MPSYGDLENRDGRKTLPCEINVHADCRKIRVTYLIAVASHEYLLNRDNPRKQIFQKIVLTYTSNTASTDTNLEIMQ